MTNVFIWAPVCTGGYRRYRVTAEVAVVLLDQVGAADGNQPVGAGLVRSLLAEAEEVGEGRQVRRPGR
jgi:hypothetical protein